MTAIAKALYYFRKLKKPVVIPSYEEKRADLLFYKNKYSLQTFVETGTFLGDTVDFFKDKFDKVYSIELSEELAQKATRRFTGDPNVKIIQGDSGIVLKELIASFSAPAMFWLDGHYSSEFFVNGEYIKTAKADKDTPIEKELSFLLHSSFQHVILIDDARLFTGLGDYPSLRTIRKMTRTAKHAYDCFVEKDIIHIIPR